MSEKISEKKKNKKIILTFDDFPCGKDTDLLLHILNKEDVKATFFVTGEKVRDSENILKKAYKEGHEIEIHCFHHIPFTDLKKDEIKREINNTSDLICSVTGKMPKFFRPPGGHINELIKEIASSFNLEVINCTINPFDYQRPGEQLLAERIFGELKRDEEIILLHDGVKETRNILPEFIKICKSMGYEFIRLTDRDKGSKIVKSNE
jgi:peptidoglycan/xylan/chitin deacetylase (PgdA/CDA1 family)